MGTYILKRIEELKSHMEKSNDPNVILYIKGKIDQCNEILDIYYSK